MYIRVYDCSDQLVYAFLFVLFDCCVVVGVCQAMVNFVVSTPHKLPQPQKVVTLVRYGNVYGIDHPYGVWTKLW